jgi:glycosyltransferase involved in cell wall biosynthesis
MWRNRLRAAEQVLEPGLSAGPGRRPTVWFEVEDFLRYFENFPTPTGLQRVAFEIYAEAERLYGRTGAVKFCRLSIYTRQLMPVEFEAIASAYTNPPGIKAPWKTIWAPARFLRNLPSALLTIMGHPGFFLSILKSAFADILAARSQRRRFEQSIKPGDIVVSLGAPWGIPCYMDHIARAKERYGVKFAILIHDLIPLEHESFVEPWHVVRFRDWLSTAIANANIVLTMSMYSRSALIAAAADRQWSLPAIEALQPGTIMSRQPETPDRTAPDWTAAKFPERFVLFVSTIEIRKNHQFLVRVWRRLLQRHGAEAVPDLIFAGQLGWKVDGLLTELEAGNYLDGKIQLRRNLSDAALRQAYSSCQFTIFPSLCEGWGLPVAESLVQGKICVASNRTSIPEVGGDFVDYFDPTDENDALAKIERLLFEPGYLQKRETRLRNEYSPPTWANCVLSFMAALDRAAADSKRYLQDSAIRQRARHDIIDVA